jgi:hypothetical protein
MTDESEEEDEGLHFAWDEEPTPLPKELAALWARAQASENRIYMRKLWEGHARLTEVPARATDNNLLPEERKKAEAVLKGTGQQLLNVLRVTAYNWLRPFDEATQLRVWQYVTETYQKIQLERR